ncbi:MAG: type IV pili twitching motility protein PilT, partial [Armatimonadota bacterium]
RRLVYEALNDSQLEQFERRHDIDFAYSVKEVARFRFNVYMQKGAVAAAMRVIPSKIPSIESLRLPPVIYEVVKKHSGLVLVTGPTGSGKSTSLACMIDLINQSRPCHILTIEDPIEYVHTHKRAMVNQREVHADTESFHNALRAILREDPDVILIGEMRDLETIQAALTLAETGHLVFATLHTRNAPQTIDRIIDVFPPHQQEQIRVLLANTLEAVFAQQLIPMLGGGRIAAIEVMLANSAVRNLIREGKTHQIYSIMETNAAQGMVTMDRVLADLHRNGYISYEEAVSRAIDKENFNQLLKNAA